MINTNDLYDVIQGHISLNNESLFTALPARVVSYNPDKQSVKVQPTLDLYISESKTLPYPYLDEVPVVMPSAGGGALTFPVKEGDTVLLVFTKDSIKKWVKGEGSNVSVTSKAFHSLGNAVAIVGLYTHKSHLSPNPDDVELKFNDNRIILKKDGSVEIESDSTVSISNNETELVDLISRTIDEISKITVSGTPIDNLANFTLLKEELSGMVKN